jgi:hypothetical protein
MLVLACCFPPVRFFIFFVSKNCDLGLQARRLGLVKSDKKRIAHEATRAARREPLKTPPTTLVTPSKPAAGDNSSDDGRRGSTDMAMDDAVVAVTTARPGRPSLVALRAELQNYKDTIATLEATQDKLRKELELSRTEPELLAVPRKAQDATRPNSDENRKLFPWVERGPFKCSEGCSIGLWKPTECIDRALKTHGMLKFLAFLLGTGSWRRSSWRRRSRSPGSSWNSS